MLSQFTSLFQKITLRSEPNETQRKDRHVKFCTQESVVIEDLPSDGEDIGDDEIDGGLLRLRDVQGRGKHRICWSCTFYSLSSPVWTLDFRRTILNIYR